MKPAIDQVPQPRSFGFGKILLLVSALLTFGGVAAVASYEGPHISAIRELNDCGASVYSYTAYQDRPPIYGHWKRYERWVSRDSYTVSFAGGPFCGTGLQYCSSPGKTARTATDADLAMLQDLPTAESLDLRLQSISDEGFAHLRGHPGLQRLEISGTQIGDPSLDIIASMPRLRFLYADSKMFSEPALDRLRAVPPISKSISTNENTAMKPSTIDKAVSPQSRRFGLGKIVLLISALLTSGAITALALYEGPHIDAIRKLNACGAYVSSYDAYEDRPPIYGHWQRYERWVCRDSYEISFMPSFFDNGLKFVAAPEDTARAITDADLIALQGLPTAQSLDLRGQNISDEGFAHLRGHPGLQSLEISGTQIGDLSLDVMATMPRLNYLSADRKMFSKSALDRLRAGCPNLSFSLDRMR